MDLEPWFPSRLDAGHPLRADRLIGPWPAAGLAIPHSPPTWSEPPTNPKLSVESPIRSADPESPLSNDGTSTTTSQLNLTENSPTSKSQLNPCCPDLPSTDEVLPDLFEFHETPVALVTSPMNDNHSLLSYHGVISVPLELPNKPTLQDNSDPLAEGPTTRYSPTSTSQLNPCCPDLPPTDEASSGLLELPQVPAGLDRPPNDFTLPLTSDVNPIDGLLPNEGVILVPLELPSQPDRQDNLDPIADSPTGPTPMAQLNSRCPDLPPTDEASFGFDNSSNDSTPIQTSQMNVNHGLLSDQEVISVPLELPDNPDNLYPLMDSLTENSPTPRSQLNPCCPDLPTTDEVSSDLLELPQAAVGLDNSNVPPDDSTSWPLASEPELNPYSVYFPSADEPAAVFADPHHVEIPLPDEQDLASSPTRAIQRAEATDFEALPRPTTPQPAETSLRILASILQRLKTGSRSVSVPVSDRPVVSSSARPAPFVWLLLAATLRGFLIYRIQHIIL